MPAPVARRFLHLSHASSAVVLCIHPPLFTLQCMGCFVLWYGAAGIPAAVARHILDLSHASSVAGAAGATLAAALGGGGGGGGGGGDGGGGGGDGGGGELGPGAAHANRWRRRGAALKATLERESDW